MDALTIWRSLASNECRAANMTQFTNQPVSMGADMCCESTSQTKDRHLKLATVAGKAPRTTKVPHRRIQKGTQDLE